MKNIYKFVNSKLKIAFIKEVLNNLLEKTKNNIKKIVISKFSNVNGAANPL